eukprot:9684369-Ditylum_brightwellii.AAC.1
MENPERQLLHRMRFLPLYNILNHDNGRCSTRSGKGQLLARSKGHPKEVMEKEEDKPGMLSLKSEETTPTSDMKKHKKDPQIQMEPAQIQDVTMTEAMNDMDFHPGTIFPSTASSCQQS